MPTPTLSSRRSFLRQASTATLAFLGLRCFVSCKDASPDAAAAAAAYSPFGPLVPDPDGILDLPAGFTYTVLSRTGDLMQDGLRTPAVPDGMAAFSERKGRVILVRNHEVNADSRPSAGAFGDEYELLDRVPRELIYDIGAGDRPRLGGTTTIVFDPRKQRVRWSYLSLAGTVRNCAGGPTPWNSWITCEETVERAGGSGGVSLVDHGYNFEVPAVAERKLTPPVPLVAMGRFQHEAVGVHEPSGIVFQTEDRHDSAIYRFVPNEPGRLAAGGKLQALRVRDAFGLDTRNWDETRIVPGDRVAVEWIDLDEVTSPLDDLRYRAHAAGAAIFARGEGMWAEDDAVHFVTTNGGREKRGQLWRYTPSPGEGEEGESSKPGVLELFIESTSTTLLENGDNLTIAPWGDLVVCEDGSGDQFLVGVTPAGELYHLARNARSTSELAGATFSPDGSTLFLNLQHDGLTVAITGPGP